eukprot:TRINITY_DN20014_c0_g2_i1.p1 TRINITY_DN20014_c0_g2~~TRINITY_DN20014_c0_g2_i1.p1  ORF type:complete len:290 (-),score=48.70 TRINITY_DN20014_c0_g2_i1:94-885(-)
MPQAALVIRNANGSQAFINDIALATIAIEKFIEFEKMTFTGSPFATAELADPKHAFAMHQTGKQYEEPTDLKHETATPTNLKQQTGKHTSLTTSPKHAPAKPTNLKQGSATHKTEQTDLKHETATPTNLKQQTGKHTSLTTAPKHAPAKPTNLKQGSATHKTEQTDLKHETAKPPNLRQESAEQTAAASDLEHKTAKQAAKPTDLERETSAQNKPDNPLLARSPRATTRCPSAAPACAACRMLADSGRHVSECPLCQGRRAPT